MSGRDALSSRWAESKRAKVLFLLPFVLFSFELGRAMCFTESTDRNAKGIQSTLRNTQEQNSVPFGHPWLAQLISETYHCTGWLL
jgi:hypothetical protein